MAEKDHTPHLFDVGGKRVLITGGLSGLGRAVAESFAAQGAVVSVIDVAVKGHVPLDGIRVIEGDVADPGIGKVVADVIDEMGGLDVLFANAGIDPPATDGIDWATWRRVFDVNVEGVARSVEAAVPTLTRQRSGRVIITSSIAGLRANTRIPLEYQSSKAAVAALVKGLALQLAPFGVNVNGLAPGPFATGIGNGKLRTAQGAAAAARVVPLGRVADPGEIVGAVQLLSSEASSYITGAVIPVDGGATAGVF